MGEVIVSNRPVTARLKLGSPQPIGYSSATVCLLHRVCGAYRDTFPRQADRQSLTRDYKEFTDWYLERQDYVSWHEP